LFAEKNDVFYICPLKLPTVKKNFTYFCQINNHSSLSTKVTILSLYYQLCTFLIVDNAEGGQIYRLSGSEANRAVWRVVKLCISIRNQ